MEAAPRLPMLSFDLKLSTENVSFGSKLKQYIASFYHEDPESYNNEIHSLESLRSSAVRPATDVTGCQILKQYYCQLKFLKSRFPMEKGQPCAVSFSWKDLYSGVSYTLADINFELSCILSNIGALHTQLGAADTRSSSEGMKMSCTHFQCAAWAFQHLKDNYVEMISVALFPEIIHFMQQLCLAQAQECILEKSMMDNRKSTIIAKVAVQVVDYYNSAMQTLTVGNDYNSLSDVIGSRILKDWNRYLKFKIAYHSCISFLYQGQQAEEAQKMGERVAYYQAASEQLEEARKIAKGNMGQQQHEVDEALAFTQDVVEGKKKAAKNENEFIYHEVVPEKDMLQQVNGASLVKGTPFSINDPEVSGKDLFSRLVPMEAHEASSLYSEQKAEMLRQIGAIVETKDGELVEFMSSLQLDCLNQWREAVGVPQEIVDRAAAICAKPQATQALVEVMSKLAGTCQEVESLLNEIQELIKDEEAKEQEYQKIMGNRPPGIVSTDLSREAGKYSEAHSKANESNQTLHRAMTMHMSNLKILAQPLSELKKAIPSVIPGDPSIDENIINELETLISKVDEMRAQRASLVSQLREAVLGDDITGLLVTKPPDLSTEQLFQKELTKHKLQASLIEQNLAAQDNILSALTEVYAKFAGTRRYMLDVLKKRDSTTSALIASYDAYDDLLAKANKGIEFYQKLEGNVLKLQQRVKSACRVNEEEREQMLAKTSSNTTVSDPSMPTPPKLKDYLAGMKVTDIRVPAIRPTPLGQEESKDKRLPYDVTHYHTPYYPTTQQTIPYVDPNNYYSSEIPPQNYYQNYPEQNIQSQQNYKMAYSTPQTDSFYSSNSQNYQQSYDSKIQPNYRIPAGYYQPGESYTPSSTPQMNYSTPGIYSPCTDTKAPSQKLSEYQGPPVENRVNSANSGYQPASSTAEVVTSMSYTYPANYQAPSQNGAQAVDNRVNSGNSGYQPTSQNVAAVDNRVNSANFGYQPVSSTAEIATSMTYTYPGSYQVPSQNVAAVENRVNSANYGYQPVSSTAEIATSVSYNYPANYQTPSQNMSQVPPAVDNRVSSAHYGYQPASSTAEIATSMTYTYPGNYQVPSQNVAVVDNRLNPANCGYQLVEKSSASTPEIAASVNYTYPTNYQLPSQNSANSGYQTVEKPSISTPENIASLNYTYPPNYQVGSNVSGSYPQYSNQYQAPTDEYQKQYQYIPQYYPYQPQSQTDTSHDTQQNTPDPSNQNYYFSPYGYQTIGMNPMTMIQANSNAKSTTSGSSNVDLLTGLDFSVSQEPLEPINVPSEQKDEPKIDKESPVKEKAVIKPEKNEIPVVQDQPILDPLTDSDTYNSFSQEVDKFEKFVDGLTTKTLNGPTSLDIKWKEIQEQQERDSQKCSISVARCYPMKNRFPDIMPYDHSRVELPSTKDDYINASYVKGVSLHAPSFIVTQAPLKSTIDDFWTMVWEQQIEVIVCLLGDAEITQEGTIYWPTERGSDIQTGKFRLVLQGINHRDFITERIISIGDGNKNLVVVHIQFTGWPGGGLFPTTVFPLISLANAVLACHRQQRVKNRPILIHCLSGVGRSGILCILIAAICDPIQSLDVAAIASRMSQSRKNILRDREHLKFAYQCVLQHSKDLLSGKQLQTKMQNVNIVGDDPSNNRSSASSETPTDPLKNRKKFTPESFEALKEQGITPVSDTSDPLSSLDPLWTIRK